MNINKKTIENLQLILTLPFIISLIPIFSVFIYLIILLASAGNIDLNFLIKFVTFEINGIPLVVIGLIWALIFGICFKFLESVREGM